MRVLLVTGSYPPMQCGVGDYTSRLGHALADLPGLEVAILTSTDASAKLSDKVKVLPVMPDWSLKRLPTAYGAMRTVRPDVVHIQYPTQGYAPTPATESAIPLAARTLGAEVVRTWHEPPHPRSRWFRIQSLAGGALIYTRPTFPDYLPADARRALKGRGVLIPIGSNIPASKLSEDRRKTLRAQYLEGKQRLIVFFGFLYPAKGAEMLFKIASPARDRLVFAGARPDADHYREVQRLAGAPPWNGSPVFSGYLSDDEVADLMAAADAVVLPFRSGGGIGNGTIHAALLQGTPVITTSEEPKGYDADNHVYWAKIDDVAEMRDALDRWAGSRRKIRLDEDGWKSIAEAHLTVYRSELGKSLRPNAA